MTEDNLPKRSLVDDPEFHASLADLDRGLSDEAQVANRAARGSLTDLERGLSEEAPLAGGGARPATTAVSPLAAPTVTAPSAPVVSPGPPITSPPAHKPALGGGRRPLLDLFPSPGARPAPPTAPAVPLVAPQSMPLASPARPTEDDLTPCETFYGLYEPPFSPSTDPRFFYHSAAHDHVAQAMLAAIGRHEGMVVMTGGQGLGKTMLCRAVIDQLDRRTLTSLVADRFASTEDLLKTILADFGVISHDDIARGMLTDASHADLTAALQGFLVSLAALQAFAVVILDDAHNLAIETLDQVRVLAESIGDEPALQIVLVGQPSLDKTLGGAKLGALNRRVSTRCQLKPIAADEVGGYIAHRLAVATGTSPRVRFDHTAEARVFELSDGVPRVINLVCARTLDAGFNVSASLLDDQLVTVAAEGLGLSPPRSRLSWAQRAAIVAGLLVLVLIGAAAAAFVFHSDLSALIGKWQSVPSAPLRPQPAAPAPLGLPTPP